eukprot:m.65605 g.65605  ORF g.65605 m.65605 type:complete len:452 (+) comp13998_c1_seq1:24-1379(+)
MTHTTALLEDLIKNFVGAHERWCDAKRQLLEGVFLRGAAWEDSSLYASAPSRVPRSSSSSDSRGSEKQRTSSIAAMGWMGTLGRGVGLSAFVVVVAAVLVAKLQPTLFFRVPNVGFVLWAMSGGFMPPIFNPEVHVNHTQFRSFARDGDVIVAAGAKSGTNWLLTTMHALRTLDAPELLYFPDVLRTTPWMELPLYPGESFEERWETMHNEWNRTWWDSPKYPFRVFKSHMTPEGQDSDWLGKDCVHLQSSQAVLPVRKYPKVKFISMVRNGQDVISSFAPFPAMHTEEFRNMWGGFPAHHKNLQACFDLFVPGEAVPSRCFARAWWPFRNEPNVLLLHYTNYMSHPEETIRQIADFLDIKLSDEQVAKVLNFTSFKSMKERDSAYRYHVGKHGVEHALHTFVRRGGLGEGKQIFTAEMQKQYDDFVHKVLPEPDLREWAEHGGDFPEQKK